MKLTILVDNPKSWLVPYAHALSKELRKYGHQVRYVQSAAHIPKGDVVFFLGCEHIIPKSIRARNKHNLVVHESNLPRGKGWSPLSWQIVEGRNKIVATLFEAVDAVDAGDIYGQRTLRFQGTELVDELRTMQWEATKKLILEFLTYYPRMKGTQQKGKASFYPRRTPKDSELDPRKSIAAQFEKLRVADNERYPAFFTHRGKTYVLKIYPKE